MTLVSELFSTINIADFVQSWLSKPDNSMSSWKLNLCSYMEEDQGVEAKVKSCFTRFDTSSIPSDFRDGRIRDVNGCIRKLKNDITSHESIISIYQDFACMIMIMKDKLSFKEVCWSSTRTSKRRKTEKNTWWNNELSMLWNELCNAEKDMLRSNGQAKKVKRAIFTLRKTFDRCV